MNSEPVRGSVEELRRRAAKILSLRPEDAGDMALENAHSLLRGFLANAVEMETRVQELRRVQTEVEESRKRYIELFDFAPVGYFNLDKNGVIVTTNITGADMLGVPRAQLTNTPFLSLIEPQYYDTFRSYLKEIAETGQRLSTEVQMRHRDGTVFDAQLQTVPLYEMSNLIYRVSVADISDRKRAERAMQDSEQRYRDLVDSFPEDIFEADSRGVVTYVNTKAMASYGINPGYAAERINMFAYVVPEQRNAARERFGRVLREGDIGPEEYMLLRRDGTTFPALVHTVPIMREGKLLGVRGIVVNITERKRAEEALRKSEQRFRTTLDSMLEACVILDFNWRYLYANDAAATLGRRGREERAGRTLMEVFPGIEKQDTFAHLQRAMQDRIPDTYETEFTFPEGNKAWFEVRVQPVPEGIFILYMDITQRKANEERLKRGIERLERIYGGARLTVMQPIGLLMMEHRLIERAVALLASEKARMEQTGAIAPDFVDFTVDFIRTYADKTHHAKEENVLFKAMAGKPLSPEHKKLLDEATAEHDLGRKLVGELVVARDLWASGDTGAVTRAIEAADGLVRLYPAHIEKEDRHLFPASMGYFTAEEQDDMLLEFREADRQMIHQKYTQAVEAHSKGLSRST